MAQGLNSMDSKMKSTLNIKNSVRISHYEMLCKIRMFETMLLDYFGKGVLRGTTHTYLGQEAIAVAALSYLGNNDIVTSNHRCHGHFIAYGGDCQKLLGEIKGSADGLCYGLGGSQHLQYKNFYSNGILSGMVPAATGMALAEKLKTSGAISVSFLGDGALGEGIVYESFNMASLWDIPVLYVIENNQYAQSTPIELNLAGSIKGRMEAFGIKTAEIASNDIGELMNSFQHAFEYVRKERKPFCQIVDTYRMGPHSKGDDFRSQEELQYWAQKDPVLIAKKYFDPLEIKKVEVEQKEQIMCLFETVFDKGDSEQEKIINIETDEELVPKETDEEPGTVSKKDEITMVTHINNVLHDLMQRNLKICLLGEDLLDPYGGAFKISKGLSTKFPERVFSSPVSEAGLVGLANGMALRGLLPIVEIMFGDFTTLIIDQVVNHATKFKRMYGGKVECPIIIRAPMGGYRGYGPTHSQSLEKLFFGVNGLTVVASDPLHDQRLIWERIVGLRSPCFYIENKSLYGQKLMPTIDNKMNDFYVESTKTYFPTLSLKMTPFDRPADVIILTYGGLVPMALKVAKSLFIEEEIVAKVIVPSQISPTPKNDLLKSLGACYKIVVLEEGTQRNGWGAEIAAFVSEEISEKVVIARCCAKNSIIPSSSQGETDVLPSEEKCYDTVKKITSFV